MRDAVRAIDILVADDDPDDRLMVREALDECRVAANLCFVHDGAELMDYLHRRGPYAELAREPLPGLVLLDLNMPKLDGWEALQKIKSEPRLKCIPVVVMSTSKSEEDIERCYALGSNSFITKPMTFSGLVDVMKGLGNYWIEIVERPPQNPGG